MMELKSLLTETSAISVDYPNPELKGFKIKLKYMSRDTIQKLRKQSTVMGFNKTTRMPEEEIDDDLFYKLYVNTAITDWSGLKLSYLKDLMVVDLTGIDETKELPFSAENAVMLVKNSVDFDTWVMAVINDVATFNKTV